MRTVAPSRFALTSSETPCLGPRLGLEIDSPGSVSPPSGARWGFYNVGIFRVRFTGLVLRAHLWEDDVKVVCISATFLLPARPHLAHLCWLSFVHRCHRLHGDRVADLERNIDSLALPAEPASALYAKPAAARVGLDFVRDVPICIFDFEFRDKQIGVALVLRGPQNSSLGGFGDDLWKVTAARNWNFVDTPVCRNVAIPANR